MRSFASLSERDVLALAGSQEEEDARIFEDFADGLKDTNPAAARRLARVELAVLVILLTANITGRGFRPRNVRPPARRAA
jgi:hypothetical protein